MDIDELCDQASLQLGVCPQTSKGDVVHPLVVHWGGEEGRGEQRKGGEERRRGETNYNKAMSE